MYFEKNKVTRTNVNIGYCDLKTMFCFVKNKYKQIINIPRMLLTKKIWKTEVEVDKYFINTSWIEKILIPMIINKIPFWVLLNIL